jgi:hypothetical protein
MWTVHLVVGLAMVRHSALGRTLGESKSVPIDLWVSQIYGNSETLWSRECFTTRFGYIVMCERVRRGWAVRLCGGLVQQMQFDVGQFDR